MSQSSRQRMVVPDVAMEDDAGSYTSDRGNFAMYSQQQSFGRQSSTNSGDSEILSLKRDREREGRCADCGVQTHEFQTDPQTGQSRKVALTVEQEVHRGRCLFCHPLPNSNAMMISSSQSVSSHNSMHSHHSHHSNGYHSTGLPPLHQSSPAPRHHHRNSLSDRNSLSGRMIYPDAIESRSVASTVTASIVDETLHRLENETSDLLDVLTAMRRFPDERTVQAKGLEKLWIQSYDEENSSAIGRVGGVATILQAMTEYIQQAHMQQCGCEALQNLADNEYNRDIICEQGGIQVIVNAMQRHTDVAGIQQAGCSALANLAGSPDHQLTIANVGGIHAIIAAAQRFRDEEAVLRAAYQSLRTLGYDPARHNGDAAAARQAQQQEGQPQEQPQSHRRERASQQGQQQPQTGGSQQGGNALILDQHGFPMN